MNRLILIWNVIHLIDYVNYDWLLLINEQYAFFFQKEYVQKKEIWYLLI